MHYTAAHYYDPNKAVFQDFEPFWEFVSGPIHAGSFGRRTSSTTPSDRSCVYVKAPSTEQGQIVAPSEGLQFFGHVAIDGATRSHDGDAQGRRRPRAVVDHTGAKAWVSAVG